MTQRSADTRGSRRALLAAGLAALLAAGGSALLARRPGESAATAADPERRQPPDVLLVVVDTLRADHLEAYGYGRETAPALSRLARQGTRFARAYATGPTTVPTHASLFTGRYPFQHGAYDVRYPLRPRELTLAEFMRRRGYRTFAATSSDRFQPRMRFDQGFDVFERVDDLEKNARSAAVTERALREIGGERAAPLFAFLHYFDPHSPYAPPEPYRGRWHPPRGDLPPEASGRFAMEHRFPHRPVEAETLDYLRALYDASIRYADAELGRLFEGLLRSPRAADTVIIVTSDHGEEFKEHGGMLHARELHEVLLRVPLVVWGPGRVAEGRVVDLPVQSTDVFPTVAGLIGRRPPRGVMGRDLTPWLRPGDPPAATRDPALLFHQVRPGGWAASATLNGRRFKLVAREGAPLRLYDLERDPAARRDVAAAHPRVVRRLRALVTGLGVEAAAPRRAAPVPPETLERLRELGYVDEAEEAAGGSP